MTRRSRAAVAGLLALHATLLVDGSRRNFAVVDEAAHVPAGVSHWVSGSFEAYRVNPPLARMLAALPVLAARPAGEFRDVGRSGADRPEWRLGIEFAEANAPRYVELIRLARLPGIAASVFGAWLAARWTRELYGAWAGAVAAALWCFEPTIGAFAQVVTPDVPAAVAGLGATYVYARYLGRPSWAGAVASGVALGVAESTKFTMLVLYAVWPMLWWFSGRGGRRSGARQILAIAAISLVVVNAGYGFRDALRPLGSIPMGSRLLGAEAARGSSGAAAGANRFSGSWIGAIPCPLPADYLSGIDLQQRDFEGGLASYLRGRWSHRGWWYYYLYAMGVKLPIGTLVLMAAGVGLGVSRLLREPSRPEAALLLTAVAIVGLVSAEMGFNHHMRYVLPAFPYLIVLASGVVASRVASRPLGCGLIVVLLAWSAVSVLRVHPHEMSYFHEVAGGPGRGDEHLVDSNIDWGQDLLALRDWLEDHPEARPFHLAFYHFVDPRIAGVEFELPPRGPTGLFPGDAGYEATFGPRPGWHAVSVNHLRGSRFVAPDGRGGFYHAIPGDLEYFRRFEPVARVGYSIRVFHVAAEPARATH